MGTRRKRFIIFIPLFLQSCGFFSAHLEKLPSTKISTSTSDIVQETSSYAICCGVIRGFLLSESGKDSVDIWVENYFGESFIGLHLPNKFIPETIVRTGCKLKADQGSQASFLTISDQTNQTYKIFTERDTEGVRSILRDRDGNLLILTLELGKHIYSTSHIRVYLIKKDSLNC